jgi:hypothetical protein
MNPQDKQNIRQIFLLRLYEESEGSLSNYVEIEDIGKSIGLDYENSFRIAEYLHHKGFLAILSQQGPLEITVEGIDEAEEILEGGHMKEFDSDDLKIILDELKTKIDYLSVGQEVIYNIIEEKFEKIDRIGIKDLKLALLSVLFSKSVDALKVGAILNVIFNYGT